ncbi:MAG: glycoside hydrolase family 97 protein [Bacteroidales bacterium]|nr:glycoside hydrolase family 97 protein [Bacteroidales bacterium]
MKALFCYTLFFVLIASTNFLAQEMVELSSPSGKIVLRAGIEDNKFVYGIIYNDTVRMEHCELGYVYADGDSCTKLDIHIFQERTVDEIWKPKWGQYSSIKNNFNEMSVVLNQVDSDRQIQIIFRAYDDAIAFRYKNLDSVDSITIMSEETQFGFKEDLETWWIWADYDTYEKLYNKTKLSECEHVAAPVTLKSKSGVYYCICEADIDNYSSMNLFKIDSLTFKSNLCPWSDGTKVKTKGGFESPWRVILITDNPGDLIESSTLYNLNDPPAIKELDWVKPVKYVGIWWEMHLGLSDWGMADGRHGATTENSIKYIDFAAENNFDAVLIEGWNTGWEDWGKQGAFDFVTPYSDFDIDSVVRYAKKRNIEIIGHHETGGDIISYERNLEKAFEYYKKHNIRYVKTGYAGGIIPSGESHHGQFMVNHYNKVMRTAMDYGIMLIVHEPVVPSGLARTYPNLLSFEGVRGMEWNAWSEGNPPSHTCIIPFTRGIAGPIDYTPGIFDIDLSNYIIKKKKWNSLDNGENAVHSTIANQIALMIILYSPVIMAADLVENYNNHPALNIVKMIPATWDDTKVLKSEIGEYIVIARRSGDKWFVAGITNEQERGVEINLNDFLNKNQEYDCSYITDHLLSHYEKFPEKYLMGNKVFTANESANTQMKEGGGFVMIFEPK